MTLPDTLKSSGGTSRTSGISSQVIADATGYVGSAIDNSTNLDREIDIEVVYQAASSPSANYPIKIYIIYALDGTNYEDGDAATEPVSGDLAGIAPSYADTSQHRYLLRHVRLRPYSFKILPWNDTGQSHTITINVKTANPQVVD